jgi:hypothetical protein
MWTNFIYFFRRKYQQIQRVIDFLPIIWNGFDFDYNYSIELFKKQLERQAKFLESDRAYTSDAKNTASRIRTAIQLMGKVYDDAYEMEWIGKIEEQFGKEALEWEFEDTGDGTGSSFITNKYEKWDNAEEIKLVKRELDKTIASKNKREQRNYFGKFIEHNIRYWWD